MDQIIVGVLALVALWWAVRGRPGKPVPARARCRPACRAAWQTEPFLTESLDGRDR